jgi:stress-induced morphogen
MASRNFQGVQALNREVKLIAGRFDDQDVVQKGYGFSAANTGTGTYTITLDDQYNHLLSCICQVQSTSGTDDYSVSVVSEDVDGAKTINIEVHVAAVLTDLGSGDQIHFIAALQNSSLPVK